MTPMLLLLLPAIASLTLLLSVMENKIDRYYMSWSTIICYSLMLLPYGILGSCLAFALFVYTIPLMLLGYGGLNLFLITTAYVMKCVAKCRLQKIINRARNQ